jgi:hypothetical protein
VISSLKVSFGQEQRTFLQGRGSSVPDPEQTNDGAVEPHRVPFHCWMTRSVDAELEVQLGPGDEEAKKTCSQKDLHPLCEELHGQL